MRPAACLVVAALAAGGIASPLVAAEPPRPEQVFQRSYFFEEKVRERLEAAVPPEQKALVEWGGAFIPSYMFYNDVDLDHSHVTIQDLRLWVLARLDEVHRIHARMRLRYTDWAAGDARGFRQHDLEGPNLDVGYYELDLSGAARKYGGREWPVRVTGRGGRQYIEVGRGIALANYLDAGWVRVEAKDLAVAAFAGRSIESEDNIDRSAPGFTRSRRTVYGLELTYQGISNHEPYAFFVLQRDWSEEKPPDPLQDYRYKSHYYGIGCRGGLGPRTRYAAEGIWELGKGAAHGQTAGETEPIEAFAFNAQVDHFFDHALRPVAGVEYAYASGDSDRQSATTARLGNRAGTKDEAFQGFGYVNSGLALGARFTNLQFVRLGGRFTPYEDKTRLGRLDVGANYYFLWKAERHGPTSDVLAARNSSDVGQEIDLFCEWRIFSDLSWSIHYGRFFPGQAYVDRQPRDFFFTALTISF